LPTLILYYVEYLLSSKSADAFLLLYLVTGIVFLPGWVFIARRIGKKATWLASMAVNTGAFTGGFFLGASDVPVMGHRLRLRAASKRLRSDNERFIGTPMCSPVPETASHNGCPFP
jgi:hypothetical protein